MEQVKRFEPGPVPCSLSAGLVLGPRPPEVRGPVCLAHRSAVPCSKEPNMPAVDADGQQANATRMCRRMPRTLKGKTKLIRRRGRCVPFGEAESGLQAHPRGVAGWGPDHGKASRNHFAGGGSHLPLVNTTPRNRDRACVYLTGAYCNARDTSLATEPDLLVHLLISYLVPI